jgi:hypothetical protein
MTTSIPVPAEYTTHTPNMGNWRWLKQLPVKYLNGQRVYPPITEFQVWRWSKPIAQIAERIALREWERVHGWEDAENKAGYVQYMVQLMALDQCGVFNAMPASNAKLTHPDPMDAVTKTEWNWQRWACFCRFFAGMPEQNQLYLLTMMFAQDCSWADWFFGLPCEWWVYYDPWYDNDYVWFLPRKGPFEFGTVPAGAPPMPQQLLPPEAFPPDKRPPAEVPPAVVPPTQVECPAGMTPNQQGVCEAPAPVACPNGIVDPTTGECIVPPTVPPTECPMGQVPDANGVCQPIPTPLPPPTQVQCEPGFVYDPATGICVAGGASTVGAKSGKLSGESGWKIAAASLLGLAGLGVIIGVATARK